MAGHKRSRDEAEQDNRIGLGETVSRLNGASASHDRPSNGPDDGAGSGEGWQQVESRATKRLKKLPKKESNNYPAIVHSSHARLQTFAKISDLQNLALYLIADGNAPQWVSVRHHSAVRKVVVLMVPGLETAMFDGGIPLEPPPDRHPGDPPLPEQSVDDVSTVVAQNPTTIAQPGQSNGSSVDMANEQNQTAVPAEPRNGNVGNGTEAQVGSDATPRSKRLYFSDNPPDAFYPVKLVSDCLPAPLRPLSELFEHIWPVRTPGEDRYARMHSPLAAMLSAPIVKPKDDKRSKGPQAPAEGRHWQNKRTPVTELLATTDELSEEGYVLHPAHYNGTSRAATETASREINNTTTAHGWVDTLDIPSLDAGNVSDKEIEKGSILAGRKVLAMDCEMCITSAPGVTPQVFSLTRVSLVDWDGNTVLDELVKPADPITDYLTPYSGITAELLENATTTLADVQKTLLSLLTPHTILIGHSLNSDLNALKLTHPFIIDTALLFPHPRGPPLKSSLKWLTQKYLSREIQKGHGSSGHNSVEDAKACLDLVKQKCEKGKAWGTAEASAESIFKRLSRSTRPKRDKTDAAGDEEPRTGAVVDWGEPVRGYGSQAKVAIGCESDAEVVEGIKRALTGDEDGSVVPRGGCDFVWARLRELEARRGWWNRSKLVDSDALRASTAISSAERNFTQVVAETVRHITEIHEALPACTALLVYSGSGDPRDLSEMQALQQTFKQEYRVKKWDELSVRWTDTEEQRLRRACEKARKGLGFITVK